MIWATVSSQSCFADCIELSIFACKEYNQSDFGVDYLVMSMCRAFPCVVGRGCLLWSVHTLGKTQFSFALLHFVLKAKFACYSRYLWTSYFLFHSPIMKRPSSFFLVLEGLVSLHRTVQLQLLQHYWSRHRLGLLILNGLPWKWTEIILSFLRLHPSTAFQILLLTMMATVFLLRDSCPQ